MINQHPQFFTATILKWKKLLLSDLHKTIIIESLRFLVENKRIYLYCFVVMPNHIHLIWQMRENINPSDVQRDFLKFTAQQIKFDLIKNQPDFLKEFKVRMKDRQFQFWKHRSLSLPLRSSVSFKRVVNYIHNNPLQKHWKLADVPENYPYSSARFYLTNEDRFGFITHYMR